MTALFTDEAIERMGRMAQRPDEKADLALMLTAIDAATGPADLFQKFPDTVHLAKARHADLVVVRSGDVSAVVTIDPDHPGVMVVASVYRADEAERGGDRLYPSHAFAVQS
jgi:hypothetical protein